MADIATLALAIDSRPVADASKELDRITAAARKAEDAATGFGKRTEDAGRRAAAANDNVARSANKVTAAYDKWHTAARRVATAVGAIAGALAVRSLTSYADAWSDMQSRVGAAIRDMEAAPALMKRIVDIANASYSPLDQTVEIYARNVAVLRDLGRGATEAADFTEALNHALVLTATRGERAASVQNALSKAMAVGKLQAEGLETILAHGGEVAQVLADELGTTVNGLRAMASAGKITGDVIANSLIKRLDDLRDRAGEMPATIGDAFVRIQTNLTAFIGTMDKATGASEAVATALIKVADGILWLRDRFIDLVNNLDQVAEAAATVGVALTLVFSRAALTALATSFGWLVGAVLAGLGAIKAAVVANPLGALATAITVAVTAAYYFRDEIQKAIGVDVVGIAKDAANLIIGSFVAAYEDIKFVWANFPDIIGAAVIGAVNATIAGVEQMINSAVAMLNDFIGTVNSALSMLPGGLQIGTLGEVSIGRVANDAAGRLASAVGDRNRAVQSALARDYIGEIGAAFRTSTPEAQDFASAVKAANDNLNETGGGAADKAAKAIKGVKDEADKAAESARKFGADLVKGFVSDLRSGLEQGKGFWKSFGDAALKVLDKIVDKLLNELIDAIFQVNSAGGGGGGFLGGLFRAIGSIFGFAQGGYTGPGAASQPAGIVHAGEFVFSKKAVDRIGLGYLDALHTAAKGYASGGYVRTHAPANLNLRGYQSGGAVAPAGEGAPARIDIYVYAEEGKMFRPVVRTEARGVAVQVQQAAAPGIVQGAVQATQSASRDRPGFFR